MYKNDHILLIGDFNINVCCHSKPLMTVKYDFTNTEPWHMPPPTHSPSPPMPRKNCKCPPNL